MHQHKEEEDTAGTVTVLADKSSKKKKKEHEQVREKKNEKKKGRDRFQSQVVTGRLVTFCAVHTWSPKQFHNKIESC